MDLKIQGPQIWSTIHNKAAAANTMEKKEEFIQFMTELSTTFQCIICKNHMIEYIKTHPFDPFMNIVVKSRDIGMFKWSWMFHNSVNIRLRKSYMDWNTASNMYLH